MAHITYFYSGMKDFKIDDSARIELEEALRKAGKNEIFVIGHTDENNIITSVRVVAQGNESMTPAIINNVQNGDIVLHNHPSGNVEPSEPDINIASFLGNQGVGFYIVSNDLSKIRFVTENWKGSEKKPIDLKQIAGLLGEDGPIARNLPGYEFRPGQIEMAIEVGKAFNSEKIAVIEAGTGTGKTISYLIPALLWSIENKEKVLISTNTINLQEQLLKKDIPLLQEVLDLDFKAVLIKGRNNYLCLRKAKAEESDLKLGLDEDTHKISMLLQWAQRTSDGSLSDLNFIPGNDVWDRLKCESDTCMRVKCPFYKKCFLLKARREASQADLMIVNHHLLFADLSLRSNLNNFTDIAILPPYSHIIIDEAHHIEDVSTNYFGMRISKRALLRILNRLWFQKGKTEVKGLLFFLSKKLNNINDEAVLEINRDIDLIADNKSVVVGIAGELFDEIAKVTEKSRKNDYLEIKLRIKREIEDSEDWDFFIKPKSDEFINAIAKYRTDISKLLKKLQALNRRTNEKFDSILIELRAIIGRIDEFADSIHHFIFKPVDDDVRWIELRYYKKGHFVSLNTAPLKIDQILYQFLYKQFSTIVMASATLAVDNNFDYFTNRTGLSFLEPGRLVSRIFPSPFDFKSQVIIGIPLDIPLPNGEGFIESIESIIAESIRISRGRAFVLFTSYGLLNMLHRRVTLYPGNSHINILKQGDETRHNLLKNFKKDISSILFGTDSFWEGVDVSGEALESVIIVRLPFRVPTEPVYEARREELEREGRDSFMEYTVPQAVIKFKQGFGRLIRNKNDRGSILILDKRIQGKKYGAIFLNSLPDCRTVIGTKEAVFRELERFYK